MTEEKRNCEKGEPRGGYCQNPGPMHQNPWHSPNRAAPDPLKDSLFSAGGRRCGKHSYEQSDYWLTLFEGKSYSISNPQMGTFLVVQWLRLCIPNIGGPGLIPSQGTRFHMLQLKSLHVTTKKILHAATKTSHCQIKVKKKKKQPSNVIRKYCTVIKCKGSGFKTWPTN